MTTVRQRFSIIPAMAVTDQRLEPRDLQVLCLLGRHTDDLGWCCRSQVKMARELNCGRATVQRALGRLVEAGYLEHRAKQRDSGADAAHDYRVVIDPPEPTPSSRGVPIDGQGCPLKDGQGVPAHERAPRLTTPVKREERGARDSEPEDDEPAGVEDGAGEDRRTLERRIKRLADKLRWPNWANSSTNWTLTQFAKLTPEERDRAEERAAAYLAHCGKKALSLGVYFAEKKFDDLPGEVIKAAKEAEERVPAAPFGKVWGALRFCELLAPPGPLPKPTRFLADLMAEPGEKGQRERLAHQARYGWRSVNTMHDLAARGSGLSLPPDRLWLEPLAAQFEAVRVGSDLWQAWQALHAARGWPWLPDPGRQEWVYFPAGGPDGLDEFERALESRRGEAGNDDGGREAAE